MYPFLTFAPHPLALGFGHLAGVLAQESQILLKRYGWRVIGVLY